MNLTMDSDSDESIIRRPTAHRRQLLIDDESSSSGDDSDSKTVEILDMNHIFHGNTVAAAAAARTPAQRADDDLFSEDSGSLEAMLDMLTLKKRGAKGKTENSNGKAAVLEDSKESDESASSTDDDKYLEEDDDASMGRNDESYRTDESSEDEDESLEAETFDLEDSEKDPGSGSGESSEDDDVGIPDDAPDSAWVFSKEEREYYLSKEKVPGTSWPDLRIPASLFMTLFRHQRSGVQWMAQRHAERIGGILADDMGCGKTYTTAAFLGALMRTRIIKNAVIVAPKSVLRSWEKELKRVVLKCVSCTDIKVLDSSYSEKQRRRVIDTALGCSSKRPHIVITTYGMVNNAQDLFQSGIGYWNYVILDEAHTVKNSKTQVSQACLLLARNRNTHRLMLTGTPLMNNPTELFCLIDWACSGRILGSLSRFTMNYAKPIMAARDQDATMSDIALGAKAGDVLQSILKPYMLQRLKKDILASMLPQKQEFVVWTHLSQLQRQQYATYVKNDDVIQDIMAGKKGSPLESISWLKKLCGIPMLVDNTVRDDLKAALVSLGVAGVVQQSAKLGVLLEMVPHLIRKGHRTLIFSQSTKMLDIIQFVLQSKIGNRIARIDGKTQERNRQRYVDVFNGKDSQFDIMLLSTRAGGVGLTLTGADRVIVYDPDWTDALDAQAVDRCYRIGQTKPIIVYRLISAGTVEEKIYERQVHKAGINKAVLTEGGGESVERHFKLSDLQQMFVLGKVNVAKFMDKVNKEHDAAGIHTDWSIHEFVSSHSGVVGLSRHDALYTGIVASAKADMFAQNEAPATLGRAQRVLFKKAAVDEGLLPLKQSTNATCIQPSIETAHPVQPKTYSLDEENAPNLAVASRISLTKGSQNGEIAEGLESMLARAAALKQAGKPRQALNELMKYLDDHGETLDHDDQRRLHEGIVTDSHALGLM